MLGKIKRSLRNYDRAPHQVLLELSVVEVSSEAMEVLGVDWNRYGRDPNTKMLRRLGAGEWDGLKPEYEQESFSIFTFGYVPMRTLADSLNVLRINGDAQIKAMPSIITLDGKEANFSSTQTIWVPYLERDEGAKRKELTYGINMKIEPRISAQGQVRLEIHNASVSDLTTTDKGRPKVISHAISNSVNIQDGDFLVLGGLLQKKMRRNHAGVPKAKDLPLLGHLFGQREQELSETEVLILIRPTILKTS